MGVELLVADESTWNQFMRVAGSGWKPPATPGLDTRVPFIPNRQSWSDTIDTILKTLKQGEVLHYLRIMGHGRWGQVTCGVPLVYSDLSAIAQFKRLASFCRTAITRLQLVGCEAAAECTGHRQSLEAGVQRRVGSAGRPPDSRAGRSLDLPSQWCQRADAAVFGHP